MSKQMSSVSELVHSVKSLLEGEFRQVAVQGEVTNISKTVAGHYYFTLSDDEAQVSCACFRGDVLRNPFVKKIKDGDKIIIVGHISVYAKRGVFQIIVKRASPFGLGDLKAQYEKLKLKYEKLGYFKEDIKKEIPKFPKRMAVITAPHGAALQDFLNVMKRRSLWLDIVIVPAIVQGRDSAASLVEALNKAQKIKGIETIILTRGGGALEDLWSFNDEKLVEAIYQCEIPVISAVGHQVDFTLSDFVSDLRLETPSAAAEYLSQPQMHIKSKLSELGRRLKVFLYEKQSYMQKKIQRINPHNLLSLIKLKHEKLKNRLESLKLLERREQLIGIETREQELSEYLDRMLLAMQETLKDYNQRLKHSKSMMNSLNPKNVLNRGYTYIKQGENVIMKKSKIKQDELDIVFQDGNLKVKRI
jgi:exodeoxyribonuclease VII large subunit